MKESEVRAVRATIAEIVDLIAYLPLEDFMDHLMNSYADATPRGTVRTMKAPREFELAGALLEVQKVTGKR